MCSFGCINIAKAQDIKIANRELIPGRNPHLIFPYAIQLFSSRLPCRGRDRGGIGNIIVVVCYPGRKLRCRRPVDYPPIFFHLQVVPRGWYGFRRWIGRRWRHGGRRVPIQPRLENQTLSCIFVFLAILKIFSFIFLLFLFVYFFICVFLFIS